MDFLIQLLQTLHNLLRWAVIILGLIAIVRAFNGWLGKKSFDLTNNQVGMLYTSLFDVQLLFGFLLYFYRGWINVLFGDFASAVSNPGTRFFALEHFLLMLAAAVVAHVGRSSARKAGEDAAKHRRLAIWFSLSLLILLAAVPWPFLSYGRPLLRLFGLQF
jgi:hypothetical protein